MKLLLAFFILLLASGIAGAVYFNDQAYNLGNGSLTPFFTSIEWSERLLKHRVI